MQSFQLTEMAKGKTVPKHTRRRPQVPRPLTDTHIFKRTWNQGSFVTAAADYGLGFSHYIGQLPAFSEFAALFDAYQIERVDLLFVWRPGSAADGYPTLLWAFDPDDATTPATESELMERQGVKIQAFSSARSMIRHTYRPKLSVGTLNVTGVARRGYDDSKNVWCDMGNTDIGYFGSKVWFAGFNTAATPSASILVYETYHLRLRYAR